MLTIKGAKRLIKYIGLGLCVYAALLAALVAFESGRAGAKINSLPDAIWYSLVTMTTVGYGDVYPITLGGRAVGMIFVLMSTGMLALFIGIVISLAVNRLLPEYTLWRRRHEQWYVFSSDNAASRALAAQLTDGMTIFCGKTVTMSPKALFNLPVAAQGNRILFAMDEDAQVNERLAVALKDKPLVIYCREDGLNEALPDKIIPFSDAECTSRLYWRARPWRPRGEHVAIIGDGRYARALLRQGLLTAPPDCVFDVFGDWIIWRQIHDTLQDAPDLNLELRFHDEEWCACPEVISEADRLVLCDDDPGYNRDVLCLLRQFYVLHGQLDVRCPEGLQRAFYFGDDEAVFTPELVMKQSLNARARQLHELYRNSVDYPVPPWETLSDFIKHSNLAAADHLLTKARLLLPAEDIRELTPDVFARAADAYEALTPEGIERCRRIEHSRWSLFHALYNWRYSPFRDNAERLHPALLPYEQLSQPEREKDDNAWKQLRMLATDI